MLKTFFAAAALAALAAPAMAADLAVTAPETTPAAFNWEGGYVGGFGGLFTGSSVPTVGLELGYNFLPSETLVLGVEGSALYYLDGSDHSELFVHSKLGGVVGNAIIYATAGLGTIDFGNNALWDVGAGVEFALTDKLTGDVQVFARNSVGFVPDVIHVQGGLRYHF